MNENEVEPLENLIEAALFFRGGAMSVKELAEATNTSIDEVQRAGQSLKASLEGRGLSVVIEGNRFALATSHHAHALIEKMRRDELDGPLGKAGLETLAIIVFRGPVLRSDVEYVRGVNCSTILRSMLIRGLIERVENPEDKRSFLYQATPELPAYFGIGELSEIPGYADMRAEIETLFANRDTELAKNTTDIS